MKAIPVTIETTNNYKVSIGETITTRPANLEELEVTANGTYTAPEDSGYNPVIVNVQPNLQSKTATPTESVQTVSPDAGYYGLSSVEVGAISKTYVGSDIPRKTSSDLTASGPTVSAPAGYYESGVSKDVASATQATPSISVNSSGLITATSTQEAGYISAGTRTATEQMPTQAAKTVNPTESEQTAVEAGKYTTGAVKVGAISSTYVGSGITRQDSESIEDFLDPEGGALIPSGYYEEDAWFSVPEAYHSSPTVSINSAGLITASHTQAKGYVSTSRAGTETDTLQLSTQEAATINPTESEQTAVASGKYTTGTVKVGAISSTYVGSGISRKSSTDLTSSGATVTAPAGYYASNATKTIASGTAGTPTATKGTVSNHSVSVTPSVTNTTGYITGGTKTGTAVSVSASELVSGSKSINQNGTGIDVTNYATVDVSVQTGGTYQSKTVSPSTSQQTVRPDTGYDALSSVTVNAMPSGTAGTPTATKGTVSNHSVSVTPSVTNTTGYISGGIKTGTAVSVSASELVSGSETKTDNGTYDVTNLKTLVVDIPFVTYYTGSGAPSSSLGSNGDIYLRTS